MAMYSFLSKDGGSGDDPYLSPIKAQKFARGDILGARGGLKTEQAEQEKLPEVPPALRDLMEAESSYPRIERIHLIHPFIHAVPHDHCSPSQRLICLMSFYQE